MPAVALGLTEKETGRTYPDDIAVEVGGQPVDLVATGTALREKTAFRFNVYTIVSYVAKGTDLGDDPAKGLMLADVPKRLRLDLLRGFSENKLRNSFDEDVRNNYGDRMDEISQDLSTFNAYWTRDAEKKDVIIFDYNPVRGLRTTLNGKELGVIKNKVFAQALWSVWFGKKPASSDMRKKLVAAVRKGQ